MSDRPRILICDDEPSIRESMQLILDDTYDLLFAEHGEEALQLMGLHHPDLVILDLKMPDMDGLEVLTRLKADHPEVKVLIVTGYQSVDVAKTTLQAGAHDYIPKPFERAQLTKAIERLLAAPN